MDTFSAGSLKILKESKDDFIRKYQEQLDFIVKDEELALGNKFHNLIYYLIKGFDTEKFENSLEKSEKEAFYRFKNSEIFNFIKNSEKLFAEEAFFIKDELNKKPFYLTGRFDLIVKNKDHLTILDWKTKHLPKNPKKDIQTIVYIFAASKLFKTKNIEMKYYSILENTCAIIRYEEIDFNEIKEIISKVY